MIARVWRGWTKSEDGDEYAEYVQEWSSSDSGYETAPGNRGAWILQREEGDRAEIMVVSLWDSEESIKALIGDDITVPLFYPRDEQLLVARERTVSHYLVVE